MRTALPSDALDALLARCRATPGLEALRDLVDRSDPPVQTLLAEPWALPWLERLLDDDPVLAETGPATGDADALFYAQSLRHALSHPPTTTAALWVARGLPRPRRPLASARPVVRPEPRP